jgi:putative nucleotidyltransferase with HDIG domain
MKIPNRKECFELIEKFQMPPNIKEHSLLVCQIALTMARAMNQKGAELDLAAIEAASLLHDITKSQSIKTGENHAETGGQLIKELGFGRIAEIVQQHIAISHSSASGKIREEEIVFYADKRVLHTGVVDLTERFKDLMQRYGKDAESKKRINAMKIETCCIEKSIFSQLNMSADAFDVLLAK